MKLYSKINCPELHSKETYCNYCGNTKKTSGVSILMSNLQTIRYEGKTPTEVFLAIDECVEAFNNKYGAKAVAAYRKVNNESSFVALGVALSTMRIEDLL